jgi:hypothetical protein
MVIQIPIQVFRRGADTKPSGLPEEGPLWPWRPLSLRNATANS